MQTSLQLLAAVLLFLLGLRLSAFFSGAETGFYRVSYLRLNVGAHSGDATSKRLLWFAHHPSYFVATTLVGNNVANYLTTLAIGLAVAGGIASDADWVEITATMLLAPVIFLAGELIPKNLYYRAPLQLLRQDMRWFQSFFRMFIPVSLPLIGVTRLIQRCARSEDRPMELVLGRSRLVQVLRQGHRAGLLSDVQSRLVNGLMHSAGEPMRDSMTPASRVLGVSQETSREDILEHARKFGLSHVAVHRSGAPEDWYGYLRLADVAVTRDPVAVHIRPMPEIDAGMTKLETLIALRRSGELFGRVVAEGTVVGVIHEHGLIEQMFRPPHAHVERRLGGPSH
ncbi:MAG: CNNM domain-containing protein [Planctomycetaceae bacterium]